MYASRLKMVRQPHFLPILARIWPTSAADRPSLRLPPAVLHAPPAPAAWATRPQRPKCLPVLANCHGFSGVYPRWDLPALK